MANDFERQNSSNLTAQQTFMQQVYQWMAAGLTITGVCAFWAAGNEGVLRFMLGGGFWVVFIAQLALVFGLSAMILKLSVQAAAVMFLVYSAINGLSMCYLFAVYTGASIASTFFITAGTFAGVSLFGWVTKSDLTSLRGFLFMGVIGVLIASVVNIFLKSEPLYWILTYAGLAVFIGLTAYDTQKLKQIHQNGTAAPGQLAILGALQLYLDFINMFIFLLRIFGRRRD